MMKENFTQKLKMAIKILLHFLIRIMKMKIAKEKGEKFLY